MGSRRNRWQGADPFEENNITPQDVDGILHGDLAETDHNRIVRQPVPLESITVDESIQVRTGGLNKETLGAYEAILLGDGEFPHIVVFRDDSTGALYLSDGFHRYNAHIAALSQIKRDLKRTGLSEIDRKRYERLSKSLLSIRAEIHPGGYERAYEYAEESNLRHGLRLSRGDKFNIFQRRIMRGHEWRVLSNNAIAKELGVSDTTIMRWREKLATSANAEDHMRVDARGNVIDTSNIGRASDLTDEQRLARSAVNYLLKADALCKKLGYDDNTLLGWADGLRSEWNLG